MFTIVHIGGRWQGIRCSCRNYTLEAIKREKCHDNKILNPSSPPPPTDTDSFQPCYVGGGWGRSLDCPTTFSTRLKHFDWVGVGGRSPPSPYTMPNFFNSQFQRCEVEQYSIKNTVKIKYLNRQQWKKWTEQRKWMKLSNLSRICLHWINFIELTWSCTVGIFPPRNLWRLRHCERWVSFHFCIFFFFFILVLSLAGLGLSLYALHVETQVWYLTVSLGVADPVRVFFWFNCPKF